MDRRAFLRVLAASNVLAAPLAAEAQQTGRVPVVGVLNSGFGPRSTTVSALRRTLHELGYVEGQNIALEVRFAGGKIDALPNLAAELARRHVDVLVAIGPAVLKATSVATNAIPIVALDLETDPVQGGYARSLAHPGGNITGLFLDLPELTGKWLDLVKDVVPTVRHVALVWDTATGPWQLAAAKAAARRIGIDLRVLEVTSPSDLDNALRSGVKSGSQALVELSSPLLNLDATETRVATFAIKYRLPTTSMFRSFAARGGLLAYGPNRRQFDDLRLGTYVDRILKGAKPADLPIEQPTVFELVINLKTAKALGLTIPTSLLQRADQVIE
ncbi:MAG TPA: ABC transporter substrate-binding protein [Gemmatimonadales bacterium]|nr:ABC transporter substrate-binding protein [Gemmatimonadales bacterium]